MNNCATCKFHDELGFCTKLVVDTIWTSDNEGKRFKAYYITERQDFEDDRSAFMTRADFSCINHVK